MKRHFSALILVGAIAVASLTACSFEKTCKALGCDETKIYEDGFCKYHYFINAGESIIKDKVNQGGY